MRYVSTNTPAATVSLAQAVRQCYAPGGALYIPEALPRLPQAYLNNIEEMSLREIAYVVASAFFAGDATYGMLKDVVYDAFDFNIPLVPVEGGGGMVNVLELFHGPTLAFKDISARFMARYLRSVPRTTKGDIILLVATTGNTGEAIAHGFAGMAGVQVVVLYPRGAMSAAEVGRFAGLAPNIHALEVAGDIDRCKHMVRDAVTDSALAEEMPVASANTNNIVRLLPQVAYFFHAYARLRARIGAEAEGFPLAIPCGNLSNLTSAVMAKRMGLPVGRIVAGCNAHDSLVRVLAGELPFEQVGLPCTHTLARAMDLGYPTNLPRLKALYGGSLEAMRADITAVTVDDAAIARAVAGFHADTGYMLDPHTAVAYEALRRTVPGSHASAVVLATAHPAKNADLMERLTGRRPELSRARARSCNMAPRPVKIAPTLPALKKFLHSLT